MPYSLNELKNIVEALLLTSEIPVSISQIRNVFDEDDCPDELDVERALLELQRENDNRGIEIRQIDNGYRIQSREEYAHWIQKLSEVRPRRYSRALMETLAIIAYRQPVTRGDIENIRGVSVSTEIMRTLLNNEWIRQTGHKQVPGRPALYGTTRKFLEYFNLESLNHLPVIEDVEPLENLDNISLVMQGAEDVDEGIEPQADSDRVAFEH